MRTLVFTLVLLFLSILLYSQKKTDLNIDFSKALILSLEESKINQNKTITDNQFDAELLQGQAHFWGGGIYCVLPHRQRRPFIYLGAVIKNIGTGNINSCILNNTLTSSDLNIVLQTDTNYSINNIQNLSSLQQDTFEIYYLQDTVFDALNLISTSYTFKQEALLNEIDDNNVDNSWGFPLTISDYYTENIIQRETRADTTVSLLNYSNAMSGDEIGTNFFLTCNERLDSVAVIISDSTDAETELQAFVYEAEISGSRMQPIGSSLGNSEPITIENNNIGNIMYLPFLNNGINLNADTRYIVTVKMFWNDNQHIGIKAHKPYQNNNLAFYSNNIFGAINSYQWSYTSYTPIMPIFFAYGYIPGPGLEGCMSFDTITNIKKNIIQNINIYPNPTNGIVYIEEIKENSIMKIYNMLGVEIISINNADKFNTIDLSNYNEGTYLVKIYNNNNVIVKKVILLK